MRWSTIWELTKINILYSNPQTLSAVKKKQERKPNKKFSAYKSMIYQQLMLIALFTVLYIYMFINMDFYRYPGYFSFYVGVFFVMATTSAFTSMYTIFYESNDVKLYAHLPIKPGELYVAKIISSLGMGSVFLMPVLSLFLIAFWQMLGSVKGTVIAIVLFLFLLVSSLVFSLYLVSMIGRIIVRSPHRKLVSTALMFLSTFGALGVILYLNLDTTHRQSIAIDEGLLYDRQSLPYFRGFYEVVLAPFGQSTLLHFWLPLLILILLIVGIFKKIMPNYYQEALYTSSKTKANGKKKAKRVDYRERTLKQVMVRHHLSTLQNATLLTQTYLMPLVYVVIFITPSMMSGIDFSKVITADYFGIALLIGMIFGSMCSLPTSFVGVGISLEKENFNFFKALPLNFKQFLVQKFFVLVSLQALVPALFYLALGLFYLKLSLPIILAFVLGLIMMMVLQGQLMYRRDYKLLELKWQDMTQLFSRGSGQWFVFGLTLGSIVVGTILVVISILASQTLGSPLAISGALTLVLFLLAAVLQFFLNRSFWKKI